jgi:hypothetical protein
MGFLEPHGFTILRGNCVDIWALEIRVDEDVVRRAVEYRKAPREAKMTERRRSMDLGKSRR